jgi:hypothetical protein
MYNMKLKERDIRRKTVEDPLCLENIDSDDEWIIEKEDPVLPQDALEDSWLDPAFNLDDIYVTPFDTSPSSTKKRKKDPSSNKMHANKGMSCIL